VLRKEKDPEDKAFMSKDDFSVIKSDPSVGAVLCGFDVNISEQHSAHHRLADNE
jgi:hypothetical protein